MSSGKYKFGQIVGIVIGCIAGSMLVNAVLGPRRPDHLQQYPQPQYVPAYEGQLSQPQPGVFEQALSMSKS